MVHGTEATIITEEMGIRVYCRKTLGLKDSSLDQARYEIF